MADPARTQFLTTVAAAVRTGNRFREPPSPAPDISSAWFVPGVSKLDRFIDEVRKTGAEAHCVETIETAHAVLRDILTRYSVKRALYNSTPFIASMRIPDCLREANIEAVSPHELRELNEPERRNRIFQADLGIAAPDWSFAETGSLMYSSSPDQMRMTSLAPPVHVALVARSTIVSDLFDLPALFDNHQGSELLPSNLVLITGPSKTGDIELRLTRGVHGPGEVHVIVWSAV